MTISEIDNQERLRSQATIRLAQPGDAEQLAHLAQEYFPGYPFISVFDSRALAREIALGQETRIVVEREGEIVGTAVLGTDGEIKRELVASHQRQNGLATQMTAWLADLAETQGLTPYLDARVPGMQRAAQTAGFRAYSIEPGKHAVYDHQDFPFPPDCPVNWSGPAREPMVHMTRNPLEEDQLHQDLASWPEEPLRCLITYQDQTTRANGFSESTAQARLPSPQLVADRVSLGIMGKLQAGSIQVIGSDLLMVKHKGISLVVVKPDASAFIITKPNGHLPEVLARCADASLQLVTYYAATDDLEMVNYLERLGMQPVMARPWENSWQVGWQAQFNEVTACSLPAVLHPQVAQEHAAFVERIAQHVS